MADRRQAPDGLLDDVKIYLDVTWQDPQTDRKLLMLVENGMEYLDDKLGAPGDYLSHGRPRALLMDYCRYARDGALDVFEQNFQSQILGMQNKRAVSNYAAGAIPAGE